MKKIIYRFSMILMAGFLVIAHSNFSKPLSILSKDTVSDQPAISAGELESLPTVSEPLPSDPSAPTPPSAFHFSSDLIIRAINPGYTVDGQRDVGEFIELQNVSGTPSLSLAGYSVRYTNSSGRSTSLLNFSESASLAGESLLMRLARSPGSDQADATYMTTIAMSAGTIALVYNDAVVDQVCWQNKSADCHTAFTSDHPTSLVRDLATGEFTHQTAYTPAYDSEHPGLIIAPPVNPPTTPDTPDQPSAPPDTSPEPETPEKITRCYGIEFSEILTYYSENAAEQFIELYNHTDQTVELSACALRYKKKVYSLSGELAAEKYLVFYPAQNATPFTLTKNPNKSNLLELVSADGAIIDILEYAHGQKKGTSYAKFYDAQGEELWQLTYAATPQAQNVYQEFRSCPAGKTINRSTGNCVKITTATQDAATADCPAGKYRNPLTGRCKKIESASTEPKPCAAGYERNPETNRCRKVAADNDGASYALVPTTYSSDSTFVALGIVILLVSLGVIYIILQFRREIARAVRKIRQRFHHIRKDLLAGRIRFGRHKQP